jgi:hypothetical protein
VARLKKLDQPVEDLIARLLGSVDQARLRSLLQFLEELQRDAQLSIPEKS